MKKILYVVLDGLGDTPIKELGDKTPLEAAFTPNMDKLAQKGQSGVVNTVGKGIAPESDIAVISLLGYDAHKYYTGRGPLESFAEGLKVEDGNVAFRVNFATVEDDGIKIKDRRVGRNLTTEEATLLAKEINSKVTLTSATFEFKNTIGHRGILVIRAMHSQLSAWITNTDPAYDRDGVFGLAKEKFEPYVDVCKPIPGYENSKPAQEAAALLNEFTVKSHKVLAEAAINKKRVADGKVPANIILCRDAGDHLPKFPPMSELYKVNFGSFVEMPVEKGIALLTGMAIVDVPSNTGHPDVDYSIWAKIALQKIKEFDGLYIHIKGPDEPGHDGDYNKKKASIEAIDKHFFADLLPHLKLKDCIIIVTADHSTPCRLKAHSADPAPLIVVGGNIKPDGTLSFSEKACHEGSLGELLGKDLMGLLIKLASD
ncbi:MAG: phosphoglycerate mutase [Candidatus Omnitrophica bacterium CG1_02_44_16]|nr:MAG: phosphoglycerate mutase [Candidatus Omnitrophica bacterium CG1_02_44_16]PIY82339.1 MAG: phosphoglycerate mutase [Candidatus Omnitrophica bacterium CG_4_10_14_0_8_um_filter_44_12]PIZ84170.1 MAG: phosphoglycerate mutase [Candidatus Omnitrophica bacterium CG_4_10_14_0_2_um_filter_44_9]